MQERSLAFPVLLLCATCCVLGGTGCYSYQPPTAAQRQLLRTRDQTEAGQSTYERREIQLRADGPIFAGQFDGFWVGQRRPVPRLRLQLFPDVGSKVLDLVVGPDELIVGLSPASDPYRRSLGSGSDAIERPLTLLALTLQRHWAGLRDRDVVGSRNVEDGHVLRLVPLPSGISIDVKVDRAMQVQQWRFCYRGFDWTLDEGPPLRFVADDTALEIEVSSREPVDSLPAAVFELSTAASGS